jgi:MutS-like protein
VDVRSGDKTSRASLIHSSPLVVGLVVVAVAGLLVPRIAAYLRSSLGIARDLRHDRRDPSADESLAAKYYRVLPEPELSGALDDATWDDLNMTEVFISLGRTESQPGRQFLYKTLRMPAFSSQTLRLLEEAIEKLDRDEAAASQIRAALGRLSDPRAAYLVTLLFGELPARPRIWWTFPILTGASFVCLGVVYFWPPAAVVWLAICVINISIQLFYKHRIRPFVAAYHEIPSLLRVARALGALQVEEIRSQTSILAKNEPQLRLLRRATSWLMFEAGQANEIVSTIYEYLNLLFLFDINAFVFGTHAIEKSRGLLREIFDAIGYIDMVQSIVMWRRSLASWTAPTMTAPGKRLEVRGLFHPLLAQPVSNSIQIDNTSVLITGSNMSGKTTFIRTLGVGAVLAQSLNTVCAEAWTGPFLSVRSSIARSDSLLDGKSQYFAEIESVLTLIRSRDEQRQHLFLLDELFRGTNTIERVAAASAVLSYLNNGQDIVVVATHDLELLELLGGNYQPYHFREQVAGGQISFDFLLRSGASSTRNAIEMLKLKGYPDSIVTHALKVVNEGDSRSGKGVE